MDMLKTHFTIFTPHKKQYISYKSISEARFCPHVARYIYTHTNIYMMCKCTSELGVLGAKCVGFFQVKTAVLAGVSQAGQEAADGRAGDCSDIANLDRGNLYFFPFKQQFLASYNRTSISVSIYAECNCREFRVASAMTFSFLSAALPAYFVPF